ncbi:DUF6316 family protein [Pseudomonas sp. NA-150]|uniref:DUF6316 family protein n=1 Tax=Pseudomonas sp. NA-150 TaxID=3367525 RepID=UPI0037CB2325
MLAMREQDPSPTVHFRSNRVSLVNGQFFFSTRENTLEGPFSTRTDAERETEAYISRMQRAKLAQPSSLNG